MQNLRDILKSSLGESLSALPPVERLAAAWPVAAGHAIASHSKVCGLEGARVQVEVDDRTWIPQLDEIAPRLREELCRIAHVPVTAIHFIYKP